jgi:tetratricopeptide (TPR) repeat protein
VKALRIIAPKLGVTVDYLETGRRVPLAHERELRVGNAELELRLGRDLEAAEQAFLDVLDEEEQDPVVAARAAAGLGLLAARRGDNKATIRLLVAATEGGHVRADERPDVYEALGAAYVASGFHHRAISLFEACLEELRDSEADDATLFVRFSTYLGCAHAELGNLDRARAALDEATDAVASVALPQSRINLYWARAIVAWREAESEAALRYVNRAIALLEATEDTLQLARAHVLSAQLLTLENRPEEAATRLERAEPFLAATAEAVDMGIIRAEQSKIAALRGRADEALDRAAEAAELLGEDARHLGLKWHALGLAHATAGNLDEAGKWFRQAIDTLRDQGQWREAAQTARQWADALRESGDGAGALDRMDEAVTLSVRERGEDQ